MSTSQGVSRNPGASTPAQQQGVPSPGLSGPPPVIALTDAVTYYHVPFPPGTDRAFSVVVTIQGVLGMPMVPPNIYGDARLNTWIATKVDGAEVSWDEEIPPGKFFCTQRAYFAFDSAPKVTPRAAAKNPDAGFTWGHLLTLLAQKQYRHWREIVKASAEKSLDLVDVVGNARGIARGTLRVYEENLYIVAVRRFQTKYGTWCYFPEIEVRV
ncbi:hypothetical protein C8Q79DRAFT_973991 [Trametes meyenii]|nr:hypothetical protein C8Q79DRAFT_973991 [Trametes meyenii]